MELIGLSFIGTTLALLLAQGVDAVQTTALNGRESRPRRDPVNSRGVGARLNAKPIA